MSDADTGRRIEVLGQPGDQICREETLTQLLRMAHKLADHGEATMRKGEKLKTQVLGELREFCAGPKEEEPE
jgi:hypothetical protein